ATGVGAKPAPDASSQGESGATAQGIETVARRDRSGNRGKSRARLDSFGRGNGGRRDQRGGRRWHRGAACGDTTRWGTICPGGGDGGGRQGALPLESCEGN